MAELALPWPTSVVGVSAHPGRGFTAVTPFGVTPPLLLLLILLLLFSTLLCLLSLLRSGCPTVVLTVDGASPAGSSSATAATAVARVLSAVMDMQHNVAMLIVSKGRSEDLPMCTASKPS
jgi:hypothetical protein